MPETTELFRAEFEYHVSLSEGAQVELENDLRRFLYELSPGLWRDVIEYKVEVRKGSIIVDIVAIAGSIYTAVVAYGSFRSGAEYLAKDVKRIIDLSRRFVSERLGSKSPANESISLRAAEILQLLARNFEALRRPQISERDKEQIAAEVTLLAAELPTLLSQEDQARILPSVLKLAISCGLEERHFGREYHRPPKD